MNPKLYWVYVTTKDEAEAQLIARAVVGERLAACANILGETRSIYWWEEKICEDQECAVVLKTNEHSLEELSKKIKALHSYKVPCIVALPIVDGNPAYLQWLEANLANSRRPESDGGNHRG